MKKKLLQHLFSILFVGVIFILSFFLFLEDNHNTSLAQDKHIKTYAELDFINFENPFERAMFEDVINIFYPNQKAKNDSLVRNILKYRHQQIEENLKQSRLVKGISYDKLIDLLIMFLKFVLVYILVLLLTTYGVQTFATLRFIKMKQGRSSYIMLIWHYLKEKPRNNLVNWIAYIYNILLLFSKACVKGCVYLILFSPAYVIAYSFKTRFDTNTIFFMILLGVISNGLLITYAHKFYTFLIIESRKGYVQTAIVKNLNKGYSHSNRDGVSYKSIFRIKKFFPGHVFQHIFLNAHHQYLATIKEQASFLITGLIIIEMALNIQNHLCYELMQNLLYKNYSIVLLIIFAIFLVVKATEIANDYWIFYENRKYENK